MTRIISVVGQKGGIGKTSMVQNLGAELAIAGKRVLLVDFDPQSNLTMGWGIDPMELEGSIYDGLNDPDVIQETILEVRPNLHIIPTTLDLAGAELAFIQAIDRNMKLKKALVNVSDQYDYILTDCPPSLGFFTVNSLVAGRELLIPLQVHPYAYRALDQLMAIVEQVQEINPDLALAGIALTMYDKRNSLTNAIEDAARERFGEMVFKTVIPINVRIPEATLEGVNVGEYEPSSSGANAYRDLAQEVINNE